MIMSGNIASFEIIYVIVNCGFGSKVLQKAKESGLSGGTVCLGRGTVKSSLLNFLSLYEERKEIVMLGGEKEIAIAAMNKLNQEFKFDKQHHGIIFSIGTCGIVGSSVNVCNCNNPNAREREDNKKMFQFIITIVNKGFAEDVVEAAGTSGAKGGTIVNARGSGIHETSKLFSMDIEPEKEIVMIISKSEDTDVIVNSIRTKLNLDEPGKGIIFVQDINKAYGIYS